MGSAQTSTDYRDRVCGTYLFYNGNCSNGVPSDPSYITILVEKSTMSTDSIIFTDSLQGLGQPYVRYAKLNLDSTWYSTPGYLGHFRRVDTVFIQNVWYPGPVVCYFDAKKISHIGLYNLNKKEKEWYLFPNPANNNLNILLPSNMEEISLQLLDMNGKLIKEQKFTRNAQIGVGTLPRGVYLIKLKGKDFVLNKRVVLVEF